MDKRSVKTLKAIRTAFQDLIINDKKQENFSVKQITESANINRKTFYLHFTCIEDLYSDLEKRTEEKLIKILDKKNFFVNRFSLKSFMDGMLELIDSNSPLYEKLLVDDKYKFVFRNLKEKIKEKIVYKFVKNTQPLEIEMKLEYVFSGTIKLFRVWQNHKSEMSKEQMYQIAYSIIKNGIKLPFVIE